MTFLKNTFTVTEPHVAVQMATLNKNSVFVLYFLMG